MVNYTLRGKTYHAYWWERIAPGERKKRFITLKTGDEKEARRECDRIEDELEAKRRGFHATIKWSLFCKLYKDYAIVEKVPESYERDCFTIRHFDNIIPVLNANDLNPLMLITYKTTRKSMGIKESTINRELGTLKAMTAWGKLTNFLRIDPWADVPVYEINESRPDTFIGNEDAIRKACTDSYDLVLLDLGIYTGLRRSEMARMMWKDIDFENNTLKVVSSMTRKNKTRRERVLPLHKSTRKNLLKLQKDGDREYVFGRNGEPTRRDYLSKRFKRILTWAGVKGHLHLTRHTFGTNLANRPLEGGLKTVMELLGHTRLTTSQIYVHSNAEAKKRAIDSL